MAPLQRDVRAPLPTSGKRYRLPVFTLAPNDIPAVLGTARRPRQWGRAPLGSCRVGCSVPASGSPGLIPCTNSCTFPRARSSLLVTGLGGGGGFTASFWVQLPKVLLLGPSQFSPRVPAHPALCTAQIGAPSAVWRLRCVPVLGEGVN